MQENAYFLWRDKEGEMRRKKVIWCNMEKMHRLFSSPRKTRRSVVMLEAQGKLWRIDNQLALVSVYNYYREAQSVRALKRDFDAELRRILDEKSENAEYLERKKRENWVANCSYTRAFRKHGSNTLPVSYKPDYSQQRAKARAAQWKKIRVNALEEA